MYSDEQIVALKAHVELMLRGCFWEWIHSGFLAFAGPTAVAIDIELCSRDAAGNHDHRNSAAWQKVAIDLGYHPDLGGSIPEELHQNRQHWESCADDHIDVIVYGLRADDGNFLAVVIGDCVFKHLERENDGRGH